MNRKNLWASGLVIMSQLPPHALDCPYHWVESLETFSIDLGTVA